ncbi:MAG: hypothetical protein ACR2JQ_05125 [Mycobacteriales bacterium]
MGIDAGNLIVLGQSTVTADTDVLDDATLTKLNDLVVKKDLSSTFTFGSLNGKLVHAAGGERVIRYLGQEKATKTSIVFEFAFRGHTKIQINCQATTRVSQISAGCQSLVQTLRIAAG